jgi:hypothetical protein
MKDTSMNSRRHLVAGLVIVISVALTSSAEAQLPFRWFGPKADKNAPAKSAAPDPRRLIEGNVEIAWLADPVTFPYYLEARVNGSHLEVRGYVPSKTVREQAIRTAQVYSSMPVTDALKEHSSLLVRPKTMSPQQLQSSVQSSLKMALPKQHQQFKVECGTDGKVSVIGAVNSFEERVAVSHALRRLHGCTSVQNLTSLPMEDRGPILQASRQPETKTDKPVVAQDRPEARNKWLTWPWTRAVSSNKDEPPLLDAHKPRGPGIANKQEGPIAIPVIEVKDSGSKVESKPKPAAPLSVRELQKRIQSTCPQATSVDIQFTSKTDVRISVEVRTEKDVAPTAERILALPELADYRPDLLFKIGTP